MEQKSFGVMSCTADETDLPAVERTVTSWMTDYYFTTLCRLYRDRSAEKFRKTLNIFRAIVDELESSSDGPDHSSQRTICCFLSRVMDGEDLDVHYDKNAQITPMMSALCVWDLLEDVVSDPDLHSKIRTLLIVQCVAVCLKKGNSQKAKDTLKWLEKETQIPEKLHGKLTTTVNKKDAYDKLLTNFTYNQLLEEIDTFLDTRQDCSSDFLFEAASKVVQARREGSDGSFKQDRAKKASSSPESDKSKENEQQVDPQVVKTRHKKKLLSKQTEPWKPETAKKKQEKLKRTSVCKITRRSSVSPVLQSDVCATNRSRRKWTWEEDKKLKAGVRQHGEGRWTVILNEFDFENRTSVMLKDRWRTLKKQKLV